jgi:hypothetical protein
MHYIIACFLPSANFFSDPESLLTTFSLFYIALTWQPERLFHWGNHYQARWPKDPQDYKPIPLVSKFRVVRAFRGSIALALVPG